MLGLPSTKIRQLGRLERDHIVEVIRSTGLRGPTALIREIVNQASGLPGLAVTLTTLCRGEGVMDVALGTALKRSVHAFLQRQIGETAIDILAALALGGEHGIAWAEIARAFGMSPIDVRRMIVNLESSGVVTDIDGDHVAVQPATLRYALVRDTFFTGPAPLDYRPLLPAARNIEGVVDTLIGVRGFGGQVPPDLLWGAVQTANSERLWVQFASLGPAEGRVPCKEKPELLSRLAPVALPLVPEVIDLLLSRAMDDRRNIASNPEHPLRQIQDWISAALPGNGQALCAANVSPAIGSGMDKPERRRVRGNDGHQNRLLTAVKLDRLRPRVRKYRHISIYLSLARRTHRTR